MYPHVDTTSVTRIQFREDDALVAWVAAQGLNPNDFAKQAFENEARRLRVKLKFERLKGFKVDLPPGEATRWIREDRDHGH